MTININNVDIPEKMREYLHSLSRITDRMGQVIRDCGRVIGDCDRMKRDALDIQDSALKLQQAVESLFNDLLKGTEQKEGGK